MNNRKVIAIGIDGGEFSVFERMIKKGLMPNLAAIMNRGLVRTVDTSVCGPGQGWASFITGKSPKKHGVYYWTLYKKLVNSKFFRDKRLWEVLGENEVRSCVINMSYTHPPKPLNGYMIAGLGSGLNPADKLKLTYPDELMAEVDSHVGGYIAACDYKEGSTEDHVKLVRNLIKMTQVRTRTCLYLMEKYSPDFVLPVYRGADLIQHCYWNFLEPDFNFSEKSRPLKEIIEQYYQELDRSIGALWKCYDRSINLIVSDHGFGPVKAIVHLNYYLAERGYLARSMDKSGGSAEQVNYFRSILKSLYHKTLKKYSLFKRLNRLRKELQGIDLPVDMSKTIAYCDAFGGININKKSPLIADMEKTKAELMACLREIKDPRTNEPIVEKVYLKEDSFAKDDPIAPDILFEAKEEYLLSYLMPLHENRVFRYMDREETAFFTGSHRRDGILIMEGDGLELSKDKNNINITDVSATILGLFGIKTPADFDGRIFCK